MSDEQKPDKAMKKAAKAQAKADKKRAKTEPAAPPSPSVPPEDSPAARSAAAAEKQVALQRWRVGLALITALIALGTLVVTTKPWRYLPGDSPPASTEAESANQ